jgi:hypothetical protein
MHYPVSVCAISSQVWFKYRENGFIPAYAQGLAMGLAQFPLSIIEATIFSLIMYFMVRTLMSWHAYTLTRWGAQSQTSSRVTRQQAWLKHRSPWSQAST